MKVVITTFEYLDGGYRKSSECNIKTETVIKIPKGGDICITNWNKKTLTVGIQDGEKFFTKELGDKNFEIRFKDEA